MDSSSESGSQIEGFYRTIKTYVLRQGRMTQAQQRDYNELSHVYCVPYEDKPLNLIDLFGNTNPIVIEIGFGMGSATIEIAEKNPDINYLGIEAHRPGVGRVLGEIKARGLKNLFIVEHDALDVLENMIPAESIHGFHIFFPDPWPKKKHHKRRLVQRPRTELFASKLTKDGYIYMVTDWKEYAEFALEELSQTKTISNKYSGFAEKQEWRPQTKFERKGLEAEREISELMFIKK